MSAETQACTLEVLGLAGSLRRDSYNRSLLSAARAQAPAGMRLTIYEDLGSVPLFNEDLDDAEGGPEGVRSLRAAVGSAVAGNRMSGSLWPMKIAISQHGSRRRRQRDSLKASRSSSWLSLLSGRQTKMTITLELTAEQERRLREGADSADAATMRRVLLQAIDSTIEKLLRLSAEVTPTPDFEALADSLTEEFAATAATDHRSLPDEAVTREGIYGNHP